MTAPLVLRIAWDAGLASPNRVRRMVWQQRKRVADAAKEAATLAWRAAGSPVLGVPVVVDWTIRRGRRLDPNGLYGAIKPLEDALFVKRITPDDSEKWYRYGEVRQEVGKVWRAAPEVEVRVTPQENA